MLLCEKKTAFWTKRVDDNQSSARHLWQTFDELLGRGQAIQSNHVNAAALHSFFDNKVAAVCAATADADEPMFSSVPDGCMLPSFSQITPAEVKSQVRMLPNKQCSSDPLPTWLLKNSIELLSPFLCQLFNWSMEHGTVPTRFKLAYITPILKNRAWTPRT